jgi:hypothetical protein
MSFESLLIDTAQVYKFSSADQYGESSFAAAGTAFKCRFDGKEGQRVLNQIGEEEVVDGFLYCPGSQAIDSKDEILINSVRYRIISAKTVAGFGSAHHLKLSVKRKV